MKNVVLRTAALCLSAILLLALSAPALAHERRTEGGVQAVVGWDTEPTYVGFANAVQLTLSDTAGEPIVDLGPDELKVEVSFGDEKTSPLPVEPAFRVGAFGTPGVYTAPLIPSRPGVYTFHFMGTIKGEPYDQTYTSGEGTFASPQNPADVSFPAKDPTAGELAARLDELSEGSDGDDDGGSDSTGVIAIGIAVAALALAGFALVKKSKSA